MRSTGTIIYVEASPFRRRTFEPEREGLQRDGFMVNNWLDPGPFPLEAIKIAQSDVMIVWLDSLHHRGWIKIGWALAAGLLVVAVGKQDMEIGDIPGMVYVEAFSDISNDGYRRLNYGDLKKGSE